MLSMLSDNHIFKVVIVISQISIKNSRAVEKTFFCLVEGWIYLGLFFLAGGGGYFGLNLRQLTNKKIKYWAFM